jgi:hypothetical protein
MRARKRGIPFIRRAKTFVTTLRVSQKLLDDLLIVGFPMSKMSARRPYNVLVAFGTVKGIKRNGIRTVRRPIPADEIFKVFTRNTSR